MIGALEPNEVARARDDLSERTAGAIPEGDSLGVAPRSIHLATL
jgi:hypothetical protein